jgi:hypothetical protein
VMEAVGRTVGDVLSRFGVSPALAPIVEAWPAAVGPQIARNAWPARLARDGTLLVHTSSSAWAFELGQLESRLRASLGGVAPPKLRFAVGPLPEPVTTASERDRARVVASPEDVVRAEALAAPIHDENLRKVVAKAAALSLASSASDRSL